MLIKKTCLSVVRRATCFAVSSYRMPNRPTNHEYTSVIDASPPRACRFPVNGLLCKVYGPSLVHGLSAVRRKDFVH